MSSRVLTYRKKTVKGVCFLCFIGIITIKINEWEKVKFTLLDWSDSGGGGEQFNTCKHEEWGELQRCDVDPVIVTECRYEGEGGILLW